MKKVLLIILFLVIISFTFLVFTKKINFLPTNKSTTSRVVPLCQTEELLCPDGSITTTTNIDTSCKFKACPNKEYFEGILTQPRGTEKGLVILMSSPAKNAPPTEKYTFPLNIKRDDSTASVFNQRVRVYGTFNTENTLTVNRLEAVEEDGSISKRDPIKVGETKEINGVTVTVNKITKDSRCPPITPCTGEASVNATLVKGSEKVTLDFEKSQYRKTFGNYGIHLDAVDPYKNNNNIPLVESDYILTFRVIELR